MIATRPARIDDAHAVADILAREILERVAHFGTRPPSAASLAEDIAKSPPYPFLVAADGDAVVGFARANPWKSRGAYAWTAELGVYVAEGLPEVPKSLREATDLFASSEFAKIAFGADVVEHHTHFFRTDHAAYDVAVTDWERKRYFERI